MSDLYMDHNINPVGKVSTNKPTAFDVISMVTDEIERATSKFPMWPTDPLHALAVLGEEYGELNKAVLQLCYESHKTNISEVQSEAIQTAAMAIRFLMSLNEYEFTSGIQHHQN